MTIRLLALYQGNPPNTIVTLATGTENALVAAGNATTDLSGGVPPTFTVAPPVQVGDVLYGADGVPLGVADPTGKLIFPFTGIAAPGAPTGLTLTPIAGGVLAAFTPSATLGGTATTGFEVTLSNGRVQRGAASPIFVSSPAGAVTATVKQINGAGPSVASATSASVTVTAYSAPAAPGAPTNVTLTAGNGKVTATWVAAPANGSALRNNVVTLSNGATAVAAGGATTVDVITPNGIAVTATVRATNGEGQGPVSAVSGSVTPVAGTTMSRLLNVGTNQRWLGGIIGTANDPIPASTDTPESIFRQPTMIGSGDVSEVYLFWPTWGNGNNGDESLGAFQIHSSALEFSGATAKFTYGGQENRQVLEGEMTTIQGQSAPVAGVLSDPITSAQLLAAFGKNRLNRGDKVWKRGRMIRADRTVKYGISRLMSQDTTGQSFRFKADSVAAIPDVYGTGNMTMTRTGAVGTLFSEATGFDPILLGKYVNEAGVIVLGLFGASMEHGATDTGWTAPLNSGRGMMRATFDKDGMSNPYAGLVVAAAGNGLDDMNGTNKRSYCTAAWITHEELSPGGNDLGSADATSDTAKYLSIQTQLRELWADLRVINPTLKLSVLSKPPSTVSTDGYTTDTGQTPGAEYGEGQKVELLYRDWLRSQVGVPGGIDAVIDPPAMHWTGKRWLWANANSTPAILGGAAIGVPANQNHPGTGQYKVISNDIRAFCGMPAWPNTP